MKPAEARIVAHVSADGWLTKYLEKNSLQVVNGRKYYRERIRYDIGYCNTQKILLNEFITDIGAIFGLNPRIRKTKPEVRFRSKRVYDKILSFGGGDSKSWFISEEIFSSNLITKKNYLRAFFDDEATVELLSPRVRIKSVNLNGLKDIKHLLKDVSVNSRITGPNNDKTWYLTIPRKSVYDYCKVGFLIPGKQQRLVQISSF